MEQNSSPTFYCPFQPEINELVDAVHQHTLQWAVDAGLVIHGDKRYQRLEKARFAWLTSLTQPYSQFEDLKLAADWHTWLFAHDDMMDATAVGRDPARTAAIHEDLTKVLRGGKPEQAGDSMVYTLADIRQRVINRTNMTWTERFIYSVEQYFQGNNWEAANRFENVVPDVTTYVKMRQYAGAVVSCFNIIFLTLDLAPDACFLRHVFVQQLAMMANNHICWVNDIMGVQKEIRENNMSNLVLVLQKTHNLTLDAAVELAVKYCDREIEAFIKLEKRLPTYRDEEQRQLSVYLNALQTWMCGHIQWYRETGRYSG